MLPTNPRCGQFLTEGISSSSCNPASLYCAILSGVRLSGFVDAGRAPASEREESEGAGEGSRGRLRLRIVREGCAYGWVFVGFEWDVVEEAARGSAKRGIFMMVVVLLEEGVWNGVLKRLNRSLALGF
jgi:hypothetical protein